MARKTALIKIWDGDKLVGLAWNTSTPADSATPTQEEKEFMRIFNENKQLKKAIESFGNNPAGFDWAVLDKIDTLEAENGLLKESQLTQSQREYLVKFLELRLKSKPNQAIEGLVETLKEATDG